MANLGDVTIKVNYEMTDTSREILHKEVHSLLLEILADSEHTLRGYVESVVRDIMRDEVRKQSMNTSPRLR